LALKGLDCSYFLPNFSLTHYPYKIVLIKKV